jgi:hypothetical protein
VRELILEVSSWGAAPRKASGQLPHHRRKKFLGELAHLLLVAEIERS